jgi:hypothetical protein
MLKLWIMIAALAAAAAVPGVANAIVCYTLLDKGDNVLYQDALPPFDMSDSGAALRSGMRQRNEYLMIYEVERCPSVVAVLGSTGYRPATVDEIVSGMRAYATSGRGTSGAGRAGGGRGSAAPAAPASSRSSTGMRSGY